MQFRVPAFRRPASRRRRTGVNTLDSARLALGVSTFADVIPWSIGPKPKSPRFAHHPKLNRPRQRGFRALSLYGLDAAERQAEPTRSCHQTARRRLPVQRHRRRHLRHATAATLQSLALKHRAWRRTRGGHYTVASSSSSHARVPARSVGQLRARRRYNRTPPASRLTPRGTAPPPQACTATPRAETPRPPPTAPAPSGTTSPPTKPTARWSVNGTR